MTILLLTVGINAVYIYRINAINFGTSGSEKNDDASLKDIPDNIKICNFGSSHGYYGFNYEDASEKYTCFNFGLPSQSLRYDCRILENYRDKIRGGATIFIVVSHFSFFGLSEIEGASFLQLNKRYYKFLRPQFIANYDRKTDFYVNYFPALATDNIASFLETMLFSAKDFWSDTTNRAEALKHGNARYERFIETKKDINGKRIYNHEAVNALYDMIDICRQIGATPILITTPYLKEYNDAVRQNDPEFYEDFYSIISEVVSKTGVKYYDYSSDERYTNDYSLFFNTDHLNRKGARIFTDNILHEILGIDRKTRHKPLAFAMGI